MSCVDRDGRSWRRWRWWRDWRRSDRRRPLRPPIPPVLMVDNDPDLTRWHYEPAEVTVPAGSTVVWVNQGREDHTVTADDQSFDSGYKKKGASWQRAFPRPGKYAYHCAPHPWMKGTVVVVAAGTPAPTGPPPPTRPRRPRRRRRRRPPAARSRRRWPRRRRFRRPTAPRRLRRRPGRPPHGGSEEPSAAPAASRKGSGGHLAGTIGVVLLPTLGALALGARLRRSKS